MGSTDSGRSISSGISIPQWMKNRIADRYDIDEAFSPPSHDDIFYIRYPKSTRKAEKVAVEDTIERPQQQDFSQHTEPCRQFIHPGSMNPDGNTFVKTAALRIKPQGADDEIAGEGGACGKSVVEVAKQMISSKSFLRSFNHGGSNEDIAAPDSGYNLSQRRGSKSLPASPIGSPSQSPMSSPRINRKIAHPNRFFTGTYTIPEKSAGEEPQSGYLGSWILSGLLGSREVVTGISPTLTIEEEKAEAAETVDSPNGKANDKGSSTIHFLSERQSSDPGISAGKLLPADKIILHPKPSELREMNFWSPTSM